MSRKWWRSRRWKGERNRHGLHGLHGFLKLLPLQGARLIALIPRVLPWARGFCPFRACCFQELLGLQPCLNHMWNYQLAIIIFKSRIRELENFFCMHDDRN